MEEGKRREGGEGKNKMRMGEVKDGAWKVLFPKLDRLEEDEVLTEIWNGLVVQGFRGEELWGMFWWLVGQGFGRSVVEDVLS